MSKRYSAKQIGESWYVRDAEKDFETRCDNRTMAVRLAKSLNAKAGA